MRKEIFKKLITQFFVLIIFVFSVGSCSVDSGTTPAPTTTDDGGGKIKSLSIMPSAVLSVAPAISDEPVATGSIMSSAASIMNFMKSIATGSETRSDAGILDPQTMTQFFMPLFTGLKTPAEGEVVDNTSSGWIGYYLGYPILLQIEDKTADNTNDTVKNVYYFNYLQDVNMNKKIDSSSELGGVNDTLIAQVKVATVTDDGTFGTWSLYQYVSNPFDISQKFELKASGAYGANTYNGSGNFLASNGDYTGSAKVSWSQDNDGTKYINVTNGKIKYDGTATKDFFNVESLSLAIIIDPVGSSKIVESAEIVKVDSLGIQRTINKSTTTLNDIKGTPTDVAFTINTATKALDGTITTKTVSGARTITVDTTSGLDIKISDTTSDVNQEEIVYKDDDGNVVTTSGKVTIYTNKAPLGTENKTMKAWIVKAIDMTYVTDSSGNTYPEPKDGILPVAKAAGPVSSLLSASIVANAEVVKGDYFVVVSIDVLNNSVFDSTDNTVWDDDYMAFIYSIHIDGDTTITVGGDGAIFTKNGQDTRAKLPVSVTFDQYMMDATMMATKTGILPTTIAGKGVFLAVAEITSYGANFEMPIAKGYFTAPSDVTTRFDTTVYVEGFLDYANLSKYAIGAHIDMNGDGMVNIGDFVTNSLYISPDIANFTQIYNQTTMKYEPIVNIKGFVAVDDTMTPPVGIDYSMYPLDGSVPSPTLASDTYQKELLTQYGDPVSTVVVNGSFDTGKIMLSDAGAWFAILLPANVTNSTEGTSIPPLAISKVDSLGKYSFRKFKTSDSNGNPNSFIVVGIGFRNFDPNFDTYRQMNSDDYLALSMSTDMRVGPVKFAYDGVAFRSLMWDEIMKMEVIDFTSTADFTLNTYMTLYESEQMKDTPTGNSVLSDYGLDTDSLDVSVKVNFMSNGLDTLNATSTPCIVKVYSVDATGMETQIAEQSVYLTADTAMAGEYYGSVMFTKAIPNTLYRVHSFMDYWDNATQQMVSLKFTQDITYTSGNLPVYLDLIKMQNMTYDPNKLFTISVGFDYALLQSQAGDVGTLVNNKFVYVEFTYYDPLTGGEKSFMKSAEITNVASDGSGYTEVIFTDIPQNFYNFRAFIDVDGELAPAVPTAYPFDTTTEIFPRPSGADVYPVLDQYSNIDLIWWTDTTQIVYYYFNNWSYSTFIN